MIVNSGEMSDFPTNGHTFEEIVFENEIAGVAALGKIEKFFERFGADVMADDVVLDVFEREILRGDGGEILDPVGDGKLFGDEIVGHEKPPRNYNSGEWREKPEKKITQRRR